MEHRQLGKAGLRVPVLSFGTGTFGGTNEYFNRWGNTNVSKASRLVDICLEQGVNFFDTVKWCSAVLILFSLYQAFRIKINVISNPFVRSQS